MQLSAGRSAHNPFRKAGNALSRRDLLIAYAEGRMSIQDLRHAGFERTTEILDGLVELGLRPPMAEMTGPNVASRLAGIERLDGILSRRSASDEPQR